MLQFTTANFLLMLLFYIKAAASAAYLQHGGTRLYDSLPKVTMTVGKREIVLCLYRTEPATTQVTWYNPQGRMVSNSSGLSVHQFIADRGRAAILHFTRYQQRQGGKYECRVTVPGNNTVKLPVCIGPNELPSQPSSEPLSQPSSEPSPQPSAEPPLQPSAEPPSQPPGELLSLSLAQLPSQPSLSPSSWPSSVAPSESSSEPPSQRSTEPPPLPSSEPPPQPSSEPPPQPSSEPPPQPSSEPPPQPSSEPPPQPSSEPPPQPSSEPPPQPSSEPPPQPSSEPPPQPSSEPPSQPSSEPPSQPSSEPSSQPSVTATPADTIFVTATPIPIAKPPNKVEDVRVTPTVLDSSPALEVAWQPVAGPDVTYTVKYSTDPGEVTTPPEWASEEVGVSSTFTILTTLERATTYYVWVISVSEGENGAPSNRKSGVTYNITATPTVVPTSEEMLIIGTIGGAMIVGVLLLTGIVIVIGISIMLWHKTRGVSFRPNVATEEEKVKTSPRIPHVRQGRSRMVYKEIDLIPLPAINISPAIAESASWQREVVPKSQFSQHVKAMHGEKDSGFKSEFLSISKTPVGKMDIAKAHRPKNRYCDVLTYDASRVILSVPDVNGSDYINASYINGYNRRSAYIASQGPNAETVSDFIQMLWDQRPPVVVMLTRLIERGKCKCERYWCDEVNEPLEMADRGFTVIVTGKKAYADYEIRDMTITCTADPSTEPVKLKHFFFTTWPDHGVPQRPHTMVKFIQHVRKVFLGSLDPLVVHCSAGVGRTGTFIAIDAMMQRLQERDDLDIRNFVVQMRTKRTLMVQNLLTKTLGSKHPAVD